jgi:hypothetical protein
MKKLFTRVCKFAAPVTVLAVPAFAANTGPSAPLFDAGAITGLSGNVTTLLVAFIGLGLLFTGMKYLKKSGIKA